MINQNWNISEDEKKRILFLHERATKNNYLIFEQSETESNTSNLNVPKPISFDLKNEFQSGSSTLTGTTEIDDAITQINSYYTKYNNAFKVSIEIESSESKVTQKEGMGALSKKRLETLKKYLKGKIPDNINIIEKDMKAQGPEWPYTARTRPDGTEILPNEKITKNDKMYTEFQYVKLTVKSEFDICKLSATQADGVLGESPTFISFDKTYDVGNFGNLKINIKFDCETVPDFIRIYYGGKIVGQGWVGLNVTHFKILIGLFGDNFTKGTDLKINIPTMPYDIDKATSAINNFEHGPKKILINMFPNAQYGDERGSNFFHLNKQIKPVISNIPILPNGTSFPIQLVEGVKDLRIQIFSPFSETVWLFTVSCSE